MGLAPILDPSRIEARGGNASANGRCQPTSGRRPRRLAGWRNQPAWRSPLAGARSGGWLRPADSHRPVASARQTSPPCRTGSELRRSAPATVSPQRRIPVRRSRRASLLGSDWEIPSQTTEPQAYVVRDLSLAGRHHVASRAHHAALHGRLTQWGAAVGCQRSTAAPRVAPTAVSYWPLTLRLPAYELPLNEAVKSPTNTIAKPR